MEEEEDDFNSTSYLRIAQEESERISRQQKDSLDDRNKIREFAKVQDWLVSQTALTPEEIKEDAILDRGDLEDNLEEVVHSFEDNTGELVDSEAETISVSSNMSIGSEKYTSSEEGSAGEEMEEEEATPPPPQPVILDQVFPETLEEIELVMVDASTPDSFHVFEVSFEEEFFRIEKSLTEMVWQPLESEDDLKPTFCFVWFNPETQSMHRVRVVEVEGACCSIQMLDHGTTIHNVSMAFLSHLPPAGPAHDYPALAIRAHLVDLEPADPTEGYSVGAKYFWLAACSGQLKGTVKTFDEERDSLGLEISGSDGTVMNSLLVNLGFAKYITRPSTQPSKKEDFIIPKVGEEEDSGLKMENWDPLAEEYFDLELNNQGAADDDINVALAGYKMEQEPCHRYQLFGNCPRGKLCPQRHELAPYGAVVDEALEVDHGSGNILPVMDRVKVKNVESPSLFTLVCERYKSGDLSLSIQDIASELEMAAHNEIRRNIYQEIGMLVGWKSPKHGWSRARVLGDGEGYQNFADMECLTVYLVDHGEEAQAETRQLRYLPNNLLHLPPLAVNCGLSNVAPNDNTQGWDHRALDLFKDLETKPNDFEVRAQANDTDGEVTGVNLYVNNNLVNEILVLMGLAVTLRAPHAQ